MIQTALLKSIDESIEEEVLLEINGIEFTGFTNYCPYAINIGQKYNVSLNMFTDSDISKSKTKIKEITQIDAGFGYFIRGKMLAGGLIDAGIILEEEFFAEYEYLQGEYVELEVGRIDVGFLSPMKQITLNQFTHFLKQGENIEFDYLGKHYRIFSSYAGWITINSRYKYWFANGSLDNMQKYMSVEELLEVDINNKKLKDIISEISDVYVY